MHITDHFFKLAIENLPCALLTDAQGRYVYVNPGWCNYMGFQPEEAIGKYVTELAAESRVTKVLQTGNAEIGYYIKGRNGRYLFNNCIPIKENGQLIGTIITTFFTDIDNALSFSHDLRDMTNKLKYYKEELRKLRGAKHRIDEIVGNSLQMQHLREQIYQAAKTTSTVLIEGETGCGKELIANSIHDLSTRTYNPFVKINCSAIPPELVESEFFGYDSGAFTGASKRGKPGLFEQANEGSLFLDEINQMSYFIQPKLLRVLQEKEVQHVGGNKLIPVNVRIIAATNQPLEELVNEEKFRADLYYRLNVVNIRIPPLREHLEDLPDLIQHSIRRLNHELGTQVEGISEEAEQRMYTYQWPGNVRELNNILERAINSHPYGVLSWKCFEEYFSMRLNQSALRNTAFTKTASNPSQTPYTLSDLRDQSTQQEQMMIRNSLTKHHFNKTKTAQELGISRTLLYQKLKKYKIEF